MTKELISVLTVAVAYFSLLPGYNHAATACTSGATCWQTIKPAEVDSRWANARCNDGTPGSYEFRKSPTGSNDWVILFEGGGGCDDLTLSCANRTKSLTTTSPNAHNSKVILNPGGILSTTQTNNPDFYNANLVKVKYCSSDQWSGATNTRRITSATPDCLPGDTQCGWYFSGRYNSRAAVQSLIMNHGLRDDGSQRVLFAGTSAGGFGLAANAESLTLLLPQTRTANGLYFVLDGSHIIDGWDEPGKTIGSSTLTSVNAVAAQNREFWRARYETYCERDRKSQGLDPSLCTFGSVYYRYLTDTRNGLGLKVFLQNSTLDSVALSRLKLTNTADPARERWRCAMTESLKSAKWLFAAGKSYHTLLTSNTNFVQGAANGTLRDLIGHFWRDQTPIRKVYLNPPCASLTYSY